MSTARPEPSPILVVDDDDGLRSLVVLALKRAGFEVVDAASGQAALDLVATTPVSLVVMDIGMPGMSGTEVVERLRSQPETLTLPVLLMTGSTDENSVINGLAAGADDFLPKPVRLDELVARVTAHLRRQVAWTSVVEQRSAHLARQRALIANTLRSLRPGDTPEATAQAICRQVLSLNGTAAAQLLLFELDGRAGAIGFAVAGQPDPPLRRLQHDRTQMFRARAEKGPWIESWSAQPEDPNFEDLTGLGRHLVACAPMRSEGELIGLFVIDSLQSADEAEFTESLAALVEFADLTSVLIGRDVADRTEARRARSQIRQIIEQGAFAPVFQQIVDLETDAVVGYEALTRFADGVGPEVRFREAAAVGLGSELETATLLAARSAATDLPAAAWLSVNVSPALISEHDALRSILKDADRPVVLEVTEHAEIPDYAAFRAAVANLGPETRLAVDDAGAGFASLRHILELRPAYIKLDRSLVVELDSDEARQAMIVGLRHFARSTNCRLIAEGIETDAELNILRTLGVTLAQGYILGRPAPASEA
jgi:EAL domain-containing protein (putative c-di-GMP-specific phosphodiesterase class I)/DNA-binding response OmpR family regulator